MKRIITVGLLMIMLFSISTFAATFTITQPSSYNISSSTQKDFNFTITSTTAKSFNTLLWLSKPNNSTLYRNSTFVCVNATGCSVTVSPLATGQYRWQLTVYNESTSNSSNSGRYFEILTTEAYKNWSVADNAGSDAFIVNVDDKDAFVPNDLYAGTMTSGSLSTGRLTATEIYDTGNLTVLGNTSISDNLRVDGSASTGRLDATEVYDSGNLTVLGDLTLAGSVFTINGLNLTGNETPALNSIYYLGTQARMWLYGFFNNLYLSSPPAACPDGTYMTYTELNSTTCTAAVKTTGDTRMYGNYTMSDRLWLNETDESVGAPTLAFNDGTLGLSSTDPAILMFSSGNTARLYLTGTASGVTVGAVKTNSVASPVYTFSGDTDTGFTSSAANNASVMSGNTEVARFRGNTTDGYQQLIVSPNVFSLNPNIPSLAFGNGSMGLYSSAADTLRFSMSGTNAFSMISTDFWASIGGAIRNIAPTATAPTILPFQSDANTGLGEAGLDNLSVIAGGREVARFESNTTAGYSQLILTPSSVGLDSSNPTLAFGDGDSGFYESADDNIAVGLAGSGTFWKMDTSYMGNANSLGAAIGQTISSATVPGLFPNKGDTNTGVGWAGTDQLSLIAAGREYVRVNNATDRISVKNDTWIASGNFSTEDMVNMFKVDTTKKIQVGADLVVGSLEGSPNTWQMLWSMIVDSTVAAGTKVGGVVGIDGTNLISFEAEGDGADGIRRPQIKSLVLLNVTKNITLDNTTTLNLPRDGLAGNPTLNFGDGDSGFYEQSDDLVVMSIAGSNRLYYATTGFYSGTSNGFQILYAAPTSTSPNIAPNYNDADTGVGWAAANELSLIAGGKEQMRLSNVSSQVIVGDQISKTNLNISLGNLTLYESNGTAMNCGISGGAFVCS